MLEEKLRAYIQKACPKVPADIQDSFAREMRRALREWGLAKTADRESILEKFSVQMEEKFLSSNREAGLTLNFSKYKARDEAAVRNSAETFFKAFSKTVSDYRAVNGAPSGQLCFKIEGIDMNHPKLAIVRCVVSDTLLRKRELEHGHGRTDRKKAGRPGMVKFDFERMKRRSFKANKPSRSPLAEFVTTYTP